VEGAGAERGPWRAWALAAGELKGNSGLLCIVNEILHKTLGLSGATKWTKESALLACATRRKAKRTSVRASVYGRTPFCRTSQQRLKREHGISKCAIANHYHKCRTPTNVKLPFPALQGDSCDTHLARIPIRVTIVPNPVTMIQPIESES
jgi:hypothetical protein